MTPFLVTAPLARENESVLLQDLRDFSRAANGKSPAHGSANSSTLAPWGNGTSAGSNHSANASFAFATASSSVSPALAHPGSSGKTADQRCASGSNSMTRRSFTTLKDSGFRPNSHSIIFALLAGLLSSGLRPPTFDFRLLSSFNPPSSILHPRFAPASIPTS